jgi:outer membrane protein TolC
VGVGFRLGFIRVDRGVKYGAALFILIFLSLGVPGYTETFGLDECIELALEKNPELEQEQINLEAALRATRRKWANFLPKISLTGGVSYSDMLFGSSPPNAQASPFDFSVGFSLSLPLNAGVAQAMKRTDLVLDSSRLNNEMVKDNIILQVKKAFYSLLTQRENLGLLKENVRLAEEQLAKAETNYENGLISERVLLQSRLGLENTRVHYNQKLVEYEKQKRDFFLLLGFESGEEVKLEGDIDFRIIDFDAEELIEKRLLQRKDILALQNKIDLTENAVVQSKRYTKTPSLNLSGKWTGAIQNPFQDSLNFGLTISVPIDSLIPGSKDDQDIEALEDDLKKNRIQLENTLRSAKLSIKNLAAGLKSAEESLRLSEMQIDISSRYYELAEEGFNFGTVERLELEQARQDLLNAKQQLLAGRYQYKLIQLDLLAALNLPEVSGAAEGAYKHEKEK